MSNLRRVLRVESQVAHAVPQLEIGHAPEAPARDVRRPEAPLPSSAPQLVPEGARALLAGTAEPSHECENCGKPLSGRQVRSCSGRCRADLSRKRQAKSRTARDRMIRLPLMTAKRITGDIQVRSLIAQALRALDDQRPRVTQKAEART